MLPGYTILGDPYLLDWDGDDDKHVAWMQHFSRSLDLLGQDKDYNRHVAWMHHFRRSLSPGLKWWRRQARCLRCCLVSVSPSLPGHCCCCSFRCVIRLSVPLRTSKSQQRPRCKKNSGTLDPDIFISFSYDFRFSKFFYRHWNHGFMSFLRIRFGDTASLINFRKMIRL